MSPEIDDRLINLPVQRLSPRRRGDTIFDLSRSLLTSTLELEDTLILYSVACSATLNVT